MTGKGDITKARINREVEAAASLIAALNSDDDKLNHDMVECATDLFEAVEVALNEIRDCDIIVAGVSAAVADLGKRKTRAQNRSKRLRGLIEQAFAIAEIKSHSFPCETVTIKNAPPSLVVVDESKIPSKFWDAQPPKLDKKALFDAVKLGAVEGAEKTNGGTTIQIRKS